VAAIARKTIPNSIQQKNTDAGHLLKEKNLIIKIEYKKSNVELAGVKHKNK